MNAEITSVQKRVLNLFYAQCPTAHQWAAHEARAVGDGNLTTDGHRLTRI